MAIASPAASGTSARATGASELIDGATDSTTAPSISSAPTTRGGVVACGPAGPRPTRSTTSPPLDWPATTAIVKSAVPSTCSGDALAGDQQRAPQAAEQLPGPQGAPPPRRPHAPQASATRAQERHQDQQQHQPETERDDRGEDPVTELGAELGVHPRLPDDEHPGDEGPGEADEGPRTLGSHGQGTVVPSPDSYPPNSSRPRSYRAE